MKVFPTLRLAAPDPREAARSRNAKQLIRDDDVACLRITSPGAPVASQFDGEYLGLRESMTFRAVPDALAVVAPPAKKRS